MKAIILAAGYATRLYPLTMETPKPLLNIKDKPIINFILEKLENTLVDEVFIVTNDKFFQKFIYWKSNFDFNLKITLVNDKTKTNEDRLGSLGDIKYVIESLNVEDDIIIVAGDNLFEFSLKEVIDIYEKENKSVVALFDVKDINLAKLYGIVSLNNNIINDFEEKPDNPKSTLSSTGVYVYSKETIKKLVEFVEKEGKKDKAGDFLQWLHKREEIYGYITDKKWYDIGTIDQLEKAKEGYGGQN